MLDINQDGHLDIAVGAPSVGSDLLTYSVSALDIYCALDICSKFKDILFALDVFYEFFLEFLNWTNVIEGLSKFGKAVCKGRRNLMVWVQMFRALKL